ncbi:MAG: ERCC4 domain-containing protein [Chloroflexota bacterium]
MSIEAIMVDAREPEWVRRLTFGGVPTAVLTLDYGDVHALTSDGHTLVVERKTPEDLLSSLRDDRLLPQMARMVQARLDEQARQGAFTTWPYLAITGTLYRGAGGKVVTGERGITGWNFDAVQGALLSIQEMGAFVVFAGGDEDFEACILRLASRKRDEIKLIPPRPPLIVGPGATFLAGLPGVGVENTMKLLEWSGNVPAHALAGITDLDIPCPLPAATRKRIRVMLGLKDKQRLDIDVSAAEHEILNLNQPN